VVNISSMLLEAGDQISVRESSRKQTRIVDALQLAGQSGFPAWVDVDTTKMTGKLKAIPDRGDVAQDVNESLVVELYSR